MHYCNMPIDQKVMEKEIFCYLCNPEKILKEFVLFTFIKDFSSVYYKKNKTKTTIQQNSKFYFQPLKSFLYNLNSMMAGLRQIEVLLEDRTPHKWIVPLTEDEFQAFLSRGNQAIRKVFGDGSFFSPMLFGKFFDPSDAFPLWEFEADVLLSNLRASGLNQVDWTQNDKEYVLKAELPG